MFEGCSRTLWLAGLDGHISEREREWIKTYTPCLAPLYPLGTLLGSVSCIMLYICLITLVDI